jgi:hypothetical protein
VSTSQREREISSRRVERVPERGEKVLGFAHFRDHGRRGRAFLESDFAADEVVRLYAGRPFVNRGDARVPEVLRGARLFDEAHPAMDLHAE